jgi:hypothetical protein
VRRRGGAPLCRPRGARCTVAAGRLFFALCLVRFQPGGVARTARHRRRAHSKFGAQKQNIGAKEQVPHEAKCDKEAEKPSAVGAAECPQGAGVVRLVHYRTISGESNG